MCFPPLLGSILHKKKVTWALSPFHPSQVTWFLWSEKRQNQVNGPAEFAMWAKYQGKENRAKRLLYKLFKATFRPQSPPEELIPHHSNLQNTPPDRKRSTPELFVSNGETAPESFYPDRTAVKTALKTPSTQNLLLLLLLVCFGIVVFYTGFIGELQTAQRQQYFRELLQSSGNRPSVCRGGVPLCL